MEDAFNSAIMDALAGFDSVTTTEDPRTGVERRKCVAKGFPLADSHSNIIAEDRRHHPDRRTNQINIDDIAEYLEV